MKKLTGQIRRMKFHDHLQQFLPMGKHVHFLDCQDKVACLGFEPRRSHWQICALLGSATTPQARRSKVRAVSVGGPLTRPSLAAGSDAPKEPKTLRSNRTELRSEAAPITFKVRPATTRAFRDVPGEQLNFVGRGRRGAARLHLSIHPYSSGLQLFCSLPRASSFVSSSSQGRQTRKG